MSSPIRRELQRATEAAWKAAQAQTAGSDREPRPGDVFVMAETSHLAVEWAVIGEDPASRRLYAVPADTWSQVGSHDVHVDADAACGPLSLRCGLGLWLAPEAFDPELRSGVLESADLDRARRAWQSVERGAVHATESQREADTELEYRGWIEKGPGQVRALLDRAWRLGIPPGPPFSKGGRDASLALRAPGWRGGHPPSFEKGGAGGRIFPSGRRRAGRHTLALAASVLLALTLAAGGGMIWHLRTENRVLSQATAQKMSVTLVRTRGVRKIPVPSHVRALELRIGDSYPEPHRVEVRSGDPPRTVHTSENLTVLLPTAALPASEYRVLVLALRDDGAEPIGDYRIEIEYRENERHP